MTKPKPIPDGYHSVTPYMTLADAAAAIEFYKQAFGATEVLRMPGPDGKIGHAEIQIGDCRMMLSDEFPEMGATSPKTLGGTTAAFMIYVPDVDAQFKRAIAAGGKEIRPLQTQFYGDRSGTLVDPFGHKWTISTHVEDVPEDEVQRRSEAYLAQKPS